MKARGEWNNKRRDGWVASPTHGHEFEQTPGDDEGQGSLARCSPQGHRVGLDLATEQQIKY